MVVVPVVVWGRFVVGKAKLPSSCTCGEGEQIPRGWQQQGPQKELGIIGEGAASSNFLPHCTSRIFYLAAFVAQPTGWPQAPLDAATGLCPPAPSITGGCSLSRAFELLDFPKH